MAKKKILQHQDFFDKELKRIGTDNPSLASRALSLSPFVKGRMRGNFQPYRKLIDLHKRIDSDIDSNDTMIVEKLEEIMNSKCGKISYRKIISKPRILYSIMVSP